MPLFVVSISIYQYICIIFILQYISFHFSYLLLYCKLDLYYILYIQFFEIKITMTLL